MMTMKLTNFFDEYLTWSSGIHRPKTIEANKSAFGKFLTFLKNDAISIKEVGSRHADMFISAQKSSGKKVNSVNNYFRCLKAAFNKAIQWEYIDESPFNKLKPLRREKSPPKFLNREQIETFISSIEDNDLKLLVMAYLSTGRRRNELLTLVWDDVDMKKRVYTVHSTKAHMVKDFPINDMFYGILKRMDKRTRKVFSKFNHPDSVSHKVKRALIKADLGHLKLHSLRHSFASIYLQSGGDIRTLMDLLGHAAINTTMIYSHLTESHIAEEANKVKF